MPHLSDYSQVSLCHCLCLDLLHAPPSGSSYGLHQYRLSYAKLQTLVGWGQLKDDREVIVTSNWIDTQNIP